MVNKKLRREREPVVQKKNFCSVENQRRRQRENKITLRSRDNIKIIERVKIKWLPVALKKNHHLVENHDNINEKIR